MSQEQLHRARFAVDVIYKGTKLSPSALRRVGKEISTHAHVLAFEDIKNVEVQFTPAEERTIYAHHHVGDAGYCDSGGKQSCLIQAQDGLGQEDL
jgi:hypothetical protein